jgi:peptidyl-prolyl cis-trans isomerase B (cyclophilin B)
MLANGGLTLREARGIGGVPMKKLLLSLVMIFAVCGAFAQAEEKPQSQEKPVNNPTDEVAVITTSEGVMVLEFWSDVAPKHVENFKKLAKDGFYDGTAFHRVIKGFMIQGGDPNTKDESKQALWGTGGPGWKVNAEFNERSHVRGVLSMARSQDPNSAGSQFFICHGDPSFLDRQYTAFGKLIKGDETLEKIATTQTGAQDRPAKRIHVESVKITTREEALK